MDLQILGGSVMVWCAVLVQGKTNLDIVSKKMNSNVYVFEMQLLAHGSDKLIFHQNNASRHTFKVVHL